MTRDEANQRMRDMGFAPEVGDTNFWTRLRDGALARVMGDDDAKLQIAIFLASEVERDL